MFNVRKQISKQDILDNIPEEEIFRTYLGFFSWTRPFRNPLREDKKPGCKFREKNNRVYFYDFSTGIRYDCFDVVMQTQMVSYPEALELIVKNFKTGRIDNTWRPRPIESKDWNLEIKSKSWEDEMKYWNNYYLDDKIVKGIYSTKSLKQLKENGNIKYTHYNSIAFYWEIEPKEYKFYFPFFKRKSIHYNARMILGYRELPETGNHLVITKSMKDLMVLRLFGINAISPTSETIIFNKDVMIYLKDRFQTIFTLLDNDRTGKVFTNKWRYTYNTKPLLLPDQKDISDFIEINGYRDTNQLIETTKNYFDIN